MGRIGSNVKKTNYMKMLVKSILVAGPIILLIIEGLSLLGSLIIRLLGLPSNLNTPLVVKLTGGAMILSGVILVLWLFKFRKPSDMIISTYHTFVKMFTRTPLSLVGGRSERLVVRGPQKYVRHPLYLGAIATFFGWALVTGSTPALISAAFILAWFRFVQIPFEEKELRAIFGKQYASYIRQVPMLIPLSNWKHRDSMNSI